MKNKNLPAIKNNKSNKGEILPIKVTNLKAAKRLLSRLIFNLQKGEIENQTAKDLTYLLTSYVNIFKQYELEKRIEEIEERLK
jgi:hypothetical protein